MTQFQVRVSQRMVGHSQGKEAGGAMGQGQWLFIRTGELSNQSPRKDCHDGEVKCPDCGGGYAKPRMTKSEHRSAERDLNKLCRLLQCQWPQFGIVL